MGDESIDVQGDSSPSQKRSRGLPVEKLSPRTFAQNRSKLPMELIPSALPSSSDPLSQRGLSNRDIDRARNLLIIILDPLLLVRDLSFEAFQGVRSWLWSAGHGDREVAKCSLQEGQEEKRACIWYCIFKLLESHSMRSADRETRKRLQEGRRNERRGRSSSSDQGAGMVMFVRAYERVCVCDTE
eukprot:c44994_g1_i1 orf=104-658(+)